MFAMEGRVPHQVDRHVGQRLRERRQMIGATQHQVANQVGVRFQQLQKYESGRNRIGASRLWQIANALDVPISHFFDGLTDRSSETDWAERLHTAEEEARALIRVYKGIPEPQRRQLLHLARTLSETAPAALEPSSADAA
jgi:transcriptional regulator with XRE-family HTH domain